MATMDLRQGARLPKLAKGGKTARHPTLDTHRRRLDNAAIATANGATGK